MSKRICSVAGCDGPFYCKTFCIKHYQAFRKWGDPLGRAYPDKATLACSVTGCVNPVRFSTPVPHCAAHRLRQLRHGDPLAGGPAHMRDRPCGFPTCGKRAHCKGLCNGHWNQHHKGHTLHPLRGFSKVVDGKKHCRKCDRALPVAAFGKHDGRTTHACRECLGIVNRAAKYGLTFEQMKVMLLRSCEGCGVRVTGKRQHIDHCHESGVVRGVLCNDCNLALGRVKDDPDVLRRLADYLSRARQLTLISA